MLQNKLKTWTGIFVPCAAILLLTLFVFLTSSQTEAAGTISGRVFQDFNGNGLYDTSGVSPNVAIDTGMSSVTVTVYDSSGTARGTTATAATGTYSIAATGTGPYRVEFTNLPAGYYPSARSTDSASGGSATNSGSTVQFVNDGNTSNVNLAINRNSDYSENNPTVAIPSYTAGSGVGNTSEALVTFPYSVNGVPVMYGGTETNWVKSTDVQTIGSTWGTAFQKSKRVLFNAAFLKRHTGLGSRGLDGVYTINYTNPAAPVVSGFDLQGVTPANGGASINLGSVTRTNVTGTIATGAAGDNQLSNISSNPTRDIDAFLKVGNTGYGNISLEENRNTLWLVNLNQRALISVDVSGALPGTVRQYPLSGSTGISACPNASDVFRPFAIEFYNGLGYMGGVCDASSSQNPANLLAYVYSFNPSTVSGTSIAFTTVASFALNYTREASSANSFGSTQVPADWKPWVTNWTQVTNQNTWAQPILSDIEFTANGNMELGFIDRYTYQAASNNYAPVSGGTSNITVRGAGDILHLCKSGSSYLMEGSVGCAESDTGLTPTNNSGGGNGNYGVLSTDGPSGTGEFYYFDFFDGLNATTNAQANHLETTTGGLGSIPGSSEVLTTAFDPYRGADGNVNGIFTGGIHRYDTSNGNRNALYLIQSSGFSETPFGKGSALGEIELLSSNAPIEIGNRVWRDNDGDGVQDPGEPSIAGVTVHLYDALGNVIATAVTDANGEYYFSSASGTSTGNVIFGLNLLNNTNYQIRFDNPANYTSGGPLFGIFLSPANAAFQNGDKDASDSDAVNVTNPTGSPSGTFPVISVTTGGAGQNNHTLDVGFKLSPTAASVSVSGRISASDGRGIRNVIVGLTLADGTYLWTKTGSFGYYTFDDVRAGQTVVVSVKSKRFNFTPEEKLLSLEDSVTDFDFTADAPNLSSKSANTQTIFDGRK